MEKKKCKYCQAEINSKAKKCPKCQSDLRSWFARHPIITGLLGLIVLGIILGGRGGEKQTSTSSTTETEVSQQNEEATTNEVKQVEEKATKEYQLVFTFKGNGAKKSEPFTITGDRFKIKYDCSGDLCQAFLQQPGSELMSDLIMNTTGSVKDETIFYGSGEYYINSNSLGNYEMIVEDYK